MAELVYSYEQLLEIQDRALLATVAYSGNLVEGRAFLYSEFSGIESYYLAPEAAAAKLALNTTYGGTTNDERRLHRRRNP